MGHWPMCCGALLTWFSRGPVGRSGERGRIPGGEGWHSDVDDQAEAPHVVLWRYELGVKDHPPGPTPRDPSCCTAVLSAGAGHVGCTCLREQRGQAREGVVLSPVIHGAQEPMRMRQQANSWKGLGRLERRDSHVKPNRNSRERGSGAQGRCELQGSKLTVMRICAKYQRSTRSARGRGTARASSFPSCTGGGLHPKRRHTVV